MSTSPEKITTREDLIEFIEALAKDFSSADKNWENENLPSYLEAMAAWIEDMDGYYQNKGEPIPSHPSWKTIGEILKAATIYE